MTGRALWIRRCCRVLIAIQAVGIAWCCFGIVRDLMDDAPSEYFTASALVPWYLWVMGLIGALMFITLMVLKSAERRYAWIALLCMAVITTLPFTSQLMSWIM